MSRYSGNIVYRSLAAWDNTLASPGGISTKAYTLSDGGVESSPGAQTMPWASSPGDTVHQSLPILWSIYPGMGTSGSASGSASVSADEAIYSMTSVGSLHSYAATYHLKLTNRWNAGDLQGELQTLLAQINLTNPSQVY